MVAVLLAWLVFSIIVAVAANRRGRNAVGWFFLAIITSPVIAGLLVWALPGRKDQKPAADGRMSGFTKALLILVAFALGTVLWWKINYPTYAWNQKLTVTVSTPRGEVSGSSVVAVSWAANFFSGGWGGAPFHLTLRGDATTVDLGGGQFLFAVLGYHGSKQCTGLIPLKLLRQKLPLQSDDDYWAPDTFKRVQAARGRGPITLPQQLYPVFLRFRDIKDRATVERVDPDNLAKSFGPGVRLVRVTIEITDDPVTRGIRNVLPWLSRKSVGYFPVPMAPDLPLDDSNFIDVESL